jgi:hypothetical protein
LVGVRETLLGEPPLVDPKVVAADVVVDDDEVVVVGEAVVVVDVWFSPVPFFI